MKIAASTKRLTIPSSASETETEKAFAGVVLRLTNRIDLGQIALRAEQRELGSRLFQISLGNRGRAGRRRQSSQGQVAQRRLITLSEQLKDVCALREVVMGRLRPRRLLANQSSNSQVLTPVCRRTPRVEPSFAGFEALLGLSQAAGSNQRFACGEVGLNQIALRNARSLRQRVGHAHGFVECLASRRQLDAQYFQRPLIPAHRLRAVRSVRFAGEAQIFLGAFVRSAHQMNLRERIEHCAGRLVELDGAADFECASEHLFGAFEITELNEDLAKGGECDGEAVTRSERLV